MTGPSETPSGRGEREDSIGELRRRLESIERDLAGVRELLERTSAAALPSAPALVTPPAVAAPPTTPVAVATTPPIAPIAAPPTAAKRVALPPLVHQASARQVASPPERTPLSLERFVGARLAAWAGAAAVLTAVGFFLKFAYDQGWLGRLSQTTRLVAAYVFALAIIGAGELALRRFGRAAAVGLFAAGVGTLYLATLAAAWPLEVLAAPTALLLASAVAVLGALLTLHSRMLSVGVVSIVGGLVAPLLLGVITQPGMLPPAHLTILLAIGLALAARSPEPFLPLRFVSVVGTVLIGAIWFVAIGNQSPALAVTAFAIWWSMTTVEAVLATLGARSPRANAASMLVMTFALATVGAIDAMSASVWTSAYSYIPLALALLSAMLAFQFGSGLEALRPIDRRDHDDGLSVDERARAAASRILGVALWAQSGILLIAGLGVFLRHGALAASWVAAGVATLELARRLRAMRVARFGIVALWLGAAVASVSSLMRAGFVTRPPPGNGWWLHLPPGWTGGFIAVVALAFVAWRWSRASATAGDIETDASPADARDVDLARRMPLLAPSCAVLFTLMWCIGSMLRAGACLALTLMLVPALFLTFAFRHDRLRWPSRLGAGSLVLVLLGEWFLLRIPLWHFDELTALLAPALAVPVVLWLLGLKQPQRAGQERFMVLAIASLAFVAMVEVFADLADPGSAGTERIRSDLASVILCVLGLAALRWGLWRQRKLFAATGALLVALSAIIWCLFGTLLPRLDGIFDEPLLLNATVGAGIVCILCVAVAARRPDYADVDQPSVAKLPSLLGVLLILLPIWLVSFAIDAVLDPGRGLVHEGTPRQAALSAWWGIAALCLIALGFGRRVPMLRYAGLVSLALVAVKVLIVDMQGAGTIWRVLGLLAAGLLMVATSVIYARVGKLLEEDKSARETS